MVAARVEREIALHSPKEISRHGSRIRFRASMQRPTWDALAGVSRGVIEVAVVEGEYVVHYELHFSATRMVLAMWVGVAMLWIPFGVLVLDNGPASLDAAIQLMGLVFIVVPLMGVGLSSRARRQMAQRRWRGSSAVR